MQPSRSRQHAMPADLQVLLLMRQRIKEGRIDSPFSICSHCKNGCIEHFDAAHASRWIEICGRCNGSGKIFLQVEPDFTTRLRALWKRKRTWVFKWGFRIGWALGVAILLFVLVLDFLLGWAL